MKRAAGFTLIELIAVILILGILAVTAAPQFLDMSGAARSAAAQGIAGSLGSASAMNYAGRSFSGVGFGTQVLNCNQVSNALAGGAAALPTGYTVSNTTVTAGGTANCVVTHTASGATGGFVALGIN